MYAFEAVVPAGVESQLHAAEKRRSLRQYRPEDRVGRLAAGLGRAVGLDPGHLATLRWAAGLHDIGKLIVPLAILDKPSALDAGELALMRRHTEFGHEILRQANDAASTMAADVALHHHECWDGSGYPDGLKGEAISREARLVTICDVYDALREVRPYKPSLSHGHVMRILLDGDRDWLPLKGKFDPLLLQVFAANADAFRGVFEESPV